MNHIVIIPTYKEAENIEKFIKKTFDLYSNISILVVDDSSPDGTADIVKKLQLQYKNLFILIQNQKGGLAKAYINGLKWAENNGYDLFTTIDADFSHPIEKIQTAIDLINAGCDVASGSRYIKNGRTKETVFYKNFISIGGNIYARLILGRKMIDWTEGFNTYTKNAIVKINLDSIKSKGYVFQAEMKYKAIKANCIVKEFPIVFEERQNGKSKMSLNIVLEALFSIIKIRLGL